MYNRIRLMTSLFAGFVLIACGASNPQQEAKAPDTVVKSESSETTHQTSSSTTYTPQAPAPTPHADVPLECRHSNMTVVREDATTIQCSCRGDLTEARWTSVKSKDPAVQSTCLTGLYYEFQVMRLPIRGPRAIDILAGTASSVSQAPAPPVPVAQASASAPAPVLIAPATLASAGAINTVPAPTASASASTTTSVKKTVKITKVDPDSGFRLTYECEEGVVAKRLLQQAGDKTPTEFQTCGGEGKVVCLTELAKQTDINVPPCACKSGQAPRKNVGIIWMCD
ncbi:MAG: hypothetical protein WCW31_04715 [Patescibacteria group bacterium]|jgi:hypothetical protein